MWDTTLNADTHPDLMAPLSTLILASLQEVVALVQMSMTAILLKCCMKCWRTELTAQDHYNDLQNYLTKVCVHRRGKKD